MLTLKTYQHGDTAYIDTNGIRVSGIVFKTETMLAIRPVPALVMTQEQLEGNWWNIMLKKYIKKELFLCHFDFYEEGLMSTARIVLVEKTTQHLVRSEKKRLIK